MGELLAGSSQQGILSYFGLFGRGGDGGIPMGVTGNSKQKTRFDFNWVTAQFNLV